MDNTESIASKIKALRKRKGFSQEQLAEASSLSLRTVQRIENGENVPHGDSLRKLTHALGVTPDDILDWAPIEDKGYLATMNLAALTFVLHPLLGIIVPLVMWILKKDKISMADDSGKKLISFQITWTMAMYFLELAITHGRYLRLDINFKDVIQALIQHFSVIVLIIALLYLYNIVFILINTKRNEKGIKSVFIPAIPFLR